MVFFITVYPCQDLKSGAERVKSTPRATISLNRLKNDSTCLQRAHTISSGASTFSAAGEGRPTIQPSAGYEPLKTDPDPLITDPGPFERKHIFSR